MMNKKPDYHKMHGIPKTIFIFAHKIDIVFDEKLANTYNYNGLSDFQREIITIQPSCENYYRSDESVKTTFWHEVLHFVFKILGYQSLSEDEEMIPQVALAFHQIIETSKY